ncbi:erythromycin esterase family protein [Streptomyces sp. NPDC004436]
MATDLKDTAHPVDAAALMALLPTRPRLLAVGEPTHGEDALLHLRNDLFRQLVEQEGYRTIALETDCLAGLTVDAYVTSATGTLDTAMDHGFSHGWGACEANRDLVRWMRTHNENRPPSRQVRFAGFDGPLETAGAASPRQALTALHTHLAAHLDTRLLPCTATALDDLLGPDDRWSDPAAMYDPAASAGRTPRAARLRALAEDLTALLDEHTPHLIAATSPEDWHRARLYARTATGLLRYHHLMADTTATTPERLTLLLATRDRIMAHNLLALAARGPVLAHAHNSHLQREKSTTRMGGAPLHWWSAGALAAAHLGQDYAFAATALGTITHRAVDTPPAGTLEALLSTLPQNHSLIDPRALAAHLAPDPPAPRTSPWFGYAPLDPAHLDGTDALLFVRDVPRRPAPPAT